MNKGFADLLLEGAGRRFVLLGVVVAALIVLYPVLDILLFTYLFIFLVNTVQKFLSARVKAFALLPQAWLAMLIYCVVAFLAVSLIYMYMPRIISQLVGLKVYLIELEEGQFLRHFAGPLADFLDDADVFAMLQTGSLQLFETVGRITAIALEATLAIVLSLFYFADKKHLTRFSEDLEKSLFGGAYTEICGYGKMFSASFSKVLQTQLIIALVNTAITTAGLILLGFPAIPVLILMVFLLSLIPVAGAIISVVPLCLIGLLTGGLETMLLVAGLVVLVHSIEAYFLNPRLLSHKTELPAFLVFVVLIISEHLLGVWGLIIGVPFFVFF